MRLLDRQESHNDRGAALVEFAIIMPVLLLMIFGTIQVGLATYRLQGLHAASRDAARVGSYSSTTNGEIEARALASLQSTLLETPPTITITPNATYPCANSDEVVVEIVADSPYFVPFLGDLALTLNSRAEFACEQ